MVNPLNFFRSSRNKKTEPEDDELQAAPEALQDIAEDADVVEFVDPAPSEVDDDIASALPTPPDATPSSGVGAVSPPDAAPAAEDATSPPIPAVAPPNPPVPAPPSIPQAVAPGVPTGATMPNETGQAPTPQRRTIGTLIEQSDARGSPPQPAVAVPDQPPSEAGAAFAEVVPERPADAPAVETVPDSSPEPRVVEIAADSSPAPPVVEIVSDSQPTSPAGAVAQPPDQPGGSIAADSPLPSEPVTDPPTEARALPEMAGEAAVSEPPVAEVTAEAPVAPEPEVVSQAPIAPEPPVVTEDPIASEDPITSEDPIAPEAPIEILEVATEPAATRSVASFLNDPEVPPSEPALHVVDDVAPMPESEKPVIEIVPDEVVLQVERADEEAVQDAAAAAEEATDAGAPPPEDEPAEEQPAVIEEPTGEPAGLEQVELETVSEVLEDEPVTEVLIEDEPVTEPLIEDEPVTELLIEDEPVPESLIEEEAAPELLVESGGAAESGADDLAASDPAQPADDSEERREPVVSQSDEPAKQQSDEPAKQVRVQPQVADLVPSEESRARALAATRAIYSEALQAVGRFFSAASKSKKKGGDTLPVSDVESAAAKLVSGMSREHVGDGLVAAAVGAYPDEGSFIVPHSVNVAVLSQRVARHLGLDGEELETLAVAGLLHDVGTVRIPRKTFYKDDSLSNDEWVLMRKRPTFSAEIIRSVGPGYRAVAEIAHQVHERLDGNGYPRGLHIDTIALEASILGAVDIFEAFIHPRPYKKTVPAAAMYGVDNLMRLSHQFGDGVLKALVRSVGLFPVGTCVRLNSGEVARVLRGRSTNPMRPEVEVVYDTQKRHLKKPRYVDLMATPHLYVFKPLSPEDLAEFGLK